MTDQQQPIDQFDQQKIIIENALNKPNSSNNDEKENQKINQQKQQILFSKIIPQPIEKNKYYLLFNIQEELEESTKKKLELSPIDLITTSKKYIFGNNINYYDTRYSQKWSDYRMEAFEKEMFFQKKCLDIGCHDGSLTLQIAIKFFPETMTGVDIDYRLINKAITNMHFFEKTHAIHKPIDQNTNQLPELTIDQISEVQKDNQIQTLLAKLQTFPKSFTQTFGTGSLFLNKTLDNTMKQISEIKQTEPEKTNRFPGNVQFSLANYLNSALKKQHYDTILCLSLTKYIHLNFGDYGISLLFEKISTELKIGGYLIFEPQTWKSYKKKVKLSETFKETMKKIKIKPDKFGEILEKKGIKLIKQLQSKKGHGEYGKRKMYLYQKINDI